MSEVLQNYPGLKIGETPIPKHIEWTDSSGKSDRFFGFVAADTNGEIRTWRYRQSINDETVSLSSFGEELPFATGPAIRKYNSETDKVTLDVGTALYTDAHLTSPLSEIWHSPKIENGKVVRKIEMIKKTNFDIQASRKKSAETKIIQFPVRHTERVAAFGD